MYEYKAVILNASALEKQCNELASEGWRLTSTNVTLEHKIIKAQVLAVFEREKM